MAPGSVTKETQSENMVASPSKRATKRPQSLVDFLSEEYPVAVKSNKRQRRDVDYKWEVVNVPPLPHLYSKEVTSVKLFDTNIETICGKIVDAVKAVSAYGNYDGQKAKATLRRNGMEFWIQLFEDTNALDDTCFVVELRRKTGSSIDFHRVASKILESIRPDSPPKRTRRIGEELSFKVHPTKRGPEKDDQYAQRMDIIDSLMTRDRWDACLLGIESLDFLTSKASEEMMSYVSRVILSKEPEFIDIKHKVFALVRNEVELEDDDNSMEESFLQKMRLRALSILSNSLMCVSQLTHIDFESCICLDEWVNEDDDASCLLPILLKELDNAKTSPEEAVHAAICLRVLLEKSPKIRGRAIDLGVTESVVKSQKVGHCAHRMLCSVSETLVELLGEVK